VEATAAGIVADRKTLDPYAPDTLSAVEKDKLGGTSRRTKRDDLTLPECREYWASRRTDDENRTVAATIRRAVLGVNPRPEYVADRAADFAMRHHFEQASAVPVEQLVITGLEQAMGRARPEEIERELTRQGVLLVEREGRTLATTAALMREEEGLAGYAAAGLGGVEAVGVAEGLGRKLATGETLTAGQWNAAVGLLASENRVNLVTGPAGAGKSKLLRKFDEGARRAGQSVTYLGTTSTSVRVLRKDGFDARTLARFLLDDAMQAAARGGRVVVDEASILKHADAVKLFGVARKNDLKLIFVGDPMQHGSIGRGAFMRLLTEYGGVTPFRLTEILRQQDPAYRAAAQLLSEGKAAEGFDALDALGMVREMSHGVDRYRHIAADYVQALADGVAWDDVLVVAPTLREGGFITREIRSQLRECGRLGAEERLFTRLVPVEASEAERGLASTYRVGDILQFHQNAKGGFVKGRRYAVADPAAVPVGEAAKFSVYRPESVPLAAGDVIRFTGTVKTVGTDQTLRNGEAHAVAGFTEAGDIRLAGGLVVGKEAGHFRPGFVETSVGSQGRTVRRAILGMSAAAGRAAINMQQMYVSASRASEWVRIYTDAKDDVREDIQKDSRKLLALDLKPGLPATPATADDARRRQAERHRRRSFAGRLRAEWDRFRSQPARPVARSLPSTPKPHAERVRARQAEKEHGHER
jgi:AAA domain